MFQTICNGFETHVIPLIPQMAKGTVHGDLNGLNIVVQRNDDGYSVAGVIDFGDCVHSCYVFELGIMLSYAMVNRENPISLVGPMLCGYLDTFPLSEVELDCLYYVILVRMCQSAMLGEHQYKLEPWNKYLLTHSVHAWKVIGEMLSTSKEEVDRIWMEARVKNYKDL